MKLQDVKTVGVAGAGTMGRGIAETLATHGYKVLLADQDLPTAESGRERIRASLDRAVSKQKIVATEAEAALARVRPLGSLKELGPADLVIEAVYEDFAVKREAFLALDAACRPEVVLATNTSSLPITRVAAVTRRPEQVVGMHFMNPVPVMKLVELIRAHKTSDATLDLVRELALKLGKTPVTVADYPGFVSNRVLMPLINEAVYCLMEGVGTAEDIDTVLKLGMNHPMGPLQLADFIGLDVCVAILDVLQEGFGDPKYRACPLLRRMVEAGDLGKKTGRGFYDYS